MAISLRKNFVSSVRMRLFGGLIFALVIVFAWIHQFSSVYASTGSWQNIQIPKITWENSSLSETLRPSSCTETAVSVMLYNQLRSSTGCGRQIGPINLVKYEAYINYNTHNMRAIQFPGDSRFYNVNMSYGTDYRPVPNSEKMIEFNSSAEILIHNNVPQHLTKVTYGTNGQNEYVYAPDIVHSVKRSDGSYMDIGQRRAISPNGKWLVVYDSGTGLVRVNLDTYETRLLDNSMGLNGNALLDVSNNGEVALYSGSGYVSAFIFDGKDCGTSNIASAQIPNPCPYFDAGTYIRSLNLGLGNAWQVDIDLSDDGHEFRFKSCTTTQPFDCKIYTLTNLTESATYTQADQLEYLALGDSYSSGEGDTARNPADNSKYYRFGTDVNGDASNNIPREKCHISTRSYPYILSKGMALGDPSNDNATKWQSVACSGAQMVDVSPQDKDSDRGQGSRLKDISNHAELKSQALNEFIPGRVKQIEFVRKYKPKVISLTMGGNDVGFAKVIEACATPLTTTTTCKYVGEGRPKLAKDILDRYGALKKLYEDIYNESGKQAKIYVLGYPQFINDSNPAQCGQNIGFINAEEREMISNAVTLMNRVISQAAMAAGVKYIDIEDSLDGGRLCDDGQRYVTGMVGVPVGISNELHESFHPNAKGHFEIAMTTWDAVNHESLLDYDTCPASQENRCPNATATKDNIVLPSYFDEVSSENSYYTTITAQQASKENPLEVKIEPYSLRPQSSANITLHSDPVNLGDFTVSTDGSLNEDIVIPSTVPAGYHTLIVAGKTYSGEPVQYEQIVLVTGANPDDLDEDGASDTSQPCGPFMVASGQDADLDGIDDACDPEISDTSQLYRVRQGDPSRTYDNQPEKDYYLYIERNTHASSLTGINGDYDPDGDGWAIVGASQGKQYTSTSVPDTGPAANFTVAGNGTIGNPYQPIVSIRAGGWGCATYRPTSLGKVTPGQVRTFTRVAVNTDTCRQELPEDDIDGNAIADNVQPLYVARNGNSTKGEDPARIYLYRNFYASEAQLGISDYTSTGTAANTIAALPLIPTIGDSPNHPTFGAAFSPIQQWNLLSISKANEYIPPFNKLVILQDGNGSPLPTILTKKLNGQCIAYQPSNTSVIKFIQQNNLVKLAGLPGGVNCE